METVLLYIFIQYIRSHKSWQRGKCKMNLWKREASRQKNNDSQSTRTSQQQNQKKRRTDSHLTTQRLHSTAFISAKGLWLLQLARTNSLLKTLPLSSLLLAQDNLLLCYTPSTLIACTMFFALLALLCVIVALIFLPLFADEDNRGLWVERICSCRWIPYVL